jgi:hypothetical protein
VRPLVIALALTVAAAGCGGRSPATTPAGKSSVAASRSRSNPTAPLVSDRVLTGQSRVLLSGLRNPHAYAVRGALYVAQDLTSPADTANGIISELMRVDPVSGRVLSARRLGSQFDQAVLAASDLWVITHSFTGPRRRGYRLLRLDPRSLAIRSRTILREPLRNPPLGSLAVAGHGLWVGTVTLDRVSLSSGLVERIVKLRYRGPVQVAADPTGRVLLATLGLEHPTYIARLNPRTGAVQARATVLWSALQPSIDGIVAGGAWIDNGGGMTTTSWRIDLQTLKMTPTQVPAIPGSRVFASAIDGILWVTKPDRGHLVTYCADPVTGARLAPLPRLGTNSTLLTAQANSIYYSDWSPRTNSLALKRAPIDPRCVSK